MSARVAPALFLALLTVSWACRKRAPEAPAAGPPLPAVEVLKDGRWLFTYLDPAATFATTDKPDAIPEIARRVVRVIDPTLSSAQRRDTAEVYVVDVAALLKDGKAATRTLSREAFETAAIAQLPPGESSSRKAPHPKAVSPDAGVTPAGRDGGPPPVVTLYGTSWCGACRTARKYFAERGIPFADKDVEEDPAAARELAEKAAKLGIPTDRVPILDVRGRLMVGFDRARVEALLGSPT